jgi:hypothetical protein
MGCEEEKEEEKIGTWSFSSTSIPTYYLLIIP